MRDSAECPKEAVLGSKMPDANNSNLAELQLEILHAQKALELIGDGMPAGWAVPAAQLALQTAVLWSPDSSRRAVWLQVQWSLGASGYLVGDLLAKSVAALVSAQAELVCDVKGAGDGR